MDKVSVIVPVYNVAGYLRRTLDSLTGQTYDDLEILVIDDCSTDGTQPLLAQYASGSKKIRALYQERNQGVSAARNRGLDAATGDWICFCDGDDWYAPEFVQTMLDCARRERADYVICDYRIAAAGRPAAAANSLSGLINGCTGREVVALGPLASCTHMISRRLFAVSGVRYPVGLSQYEELAVIPVLARYARRVGICRQPLYYYFQRGNGSSASNRLVQSEDVFRKALKAMGGALGEGWETEMEYHAIYALFYGEVLKACKRGEPAGQIRERIGRYSREYPHWRSNPYLQKMGRAKRAFLWMVHRRQIAGLRLLAQIHGKIVS